MQYVIGIEYDICGVWFLCIVDGCGELVYVVQCVCLWWWIVWDVDGEWYGLVVVIEDVQIGQVGFVCMGVDVFGECDGVVRCVGCVGQCKVFGLCWCR